MTSVEKVSNLHNTIVLDENFTFDQHKSFRGILKEALHDNGRVDIDFRNVRYIDSAGLGMLMLARHEAKNMNCDLRLMNIQPDTMEILRLVQFDRQFIVA